MYDLVFVTPLPAFYKVNLYNEVAKKKNIYVLYIGSESGIRTKDFCSSSMNFEHSFLYNDAFEKTNKIKSFFKIISFLKQVKYKRIILGGWDVLELWILAFLSPKAKNFTVIESSIYESKVHGIYLMIKKIYQWRMSGVYVSGEPQKKLAQKLGYENIITTGGVGLFNKVKYEPSTQEYKRKFLYIGRLSEEKNISHLVETFKSIPSASLEIVGNGHLRDEIKNKIENIENITLINHVDNAYIHQKYLENDVFVLPSLSEPWGLVIEEALYYGLPVVVSSAVGSKDDMVVKYKSGRVFDLEDADSLKQMIEFFLIEENYQEIKRNVDKIDFELLFKNQIQSYLK